MRSSRKSNRGQMQITQGDTATRIVTQPLGAWLYKKHAGGGSFLGGKWAKRWVHVNDERGRLHIGKKPGKDGTTVVRARARRTERRERAFRRWHRL